MTDLYSKAASKEDMFNMVFNSAQKTQVGGHP